MHALALNAICCKLLEQDKTCQGRSEDCKILPTLTRTSDLDVPVESAQLHPCCDSERQESSRLLYRQFLSCFEANLQASLADDCADFPLALTILVLCLGYELQGLKNSSFCLGKGLLVHQQLQSDP